MRRVVTFIYLLVPLMAWVTYALLAQKLSLWLANQWGAQLLRLGDGKFSDVASFIHHRCYEGTWLITWTFGLLGIAVLLGALFARRLSRLWRWVPFSVTGFVTLNLWLKLAATTCLFWCFFWNGKGTTDNLAQFHIKLLLMDEAAAPVKVVLAGSSQVRAEIDQRSLNGELGPTFFATELHFPGNRGFDFLLLDRKLGGHKVDFVVCYLSELNFFSGAISDGFSLFFSSGDVPEFLRMGGMPRWSYQKIAFGVLGDFLPVFRLRDLLAQRCLGDEFTGLLQRERNASLSSNLRQRAAEAANGYRADAQSQFSFASFETFVATCRSKSRTVVLCCGQLNPVLGQQLDPTLRPQMVVFLRRLAAKYDNVVLLEENDLPPHSEEDYEDLTHVNSAAQARFTDVIGRVLRRWTPMRNYNAHGLSKSIDQPL
jgi:hypothetical protein